MISLLARSFALVILEISAALAPPTLLQAQAGTGIADSVVVRVVQDPLLSRVATGDSSSALGPRIVRAAATAPIVLSPVVASPQGSSAHVGAGTNVALMGVGAAAIVIGLLVGGDGGAMISIGGGVLGLYGLFRYLR
jgi:hypothetical protein